MDRLQRSMIDRKGSRFRTDEPTMARPTWRRSSSTTFFCSTNRGRPLPTTDATQQPTLVQLPTVEHSLREAYSTTKTSRCQEHRRYVRSIDNERFWKTLKKADRLSRRRPSSQRWDSKKTRPKTLQVKTLRRLSTRPKTLQRENSTETFDKPKTLKAKPLQRLSFARERSFALSYTRTLFCVDFFPNLLSPCPKRRSPPKRTRSRKCKSLEDWACPKSLSSLRWDQTKTCPSTSLSSLRWDQTKI